MRALICCGMWALAASALAGDLRDPTRPPLVSSGGAVHEPVPVLSAVISSDTQRGAIVNGEFVRSGGKVGPFLIEEVLADGVRYRYAGRSQELHLPHALSTIRKPTAYPAPATSGVNP